MSLSSFGSILNFAEKIESQNMAFYSKAVNSLESGDVKTLFEQFVKECKKTITIIQRTRRENVTEMILESISDFSSKSFYIKELDASSMSADQMVESAKQLEKRSLDYSTQASAKIKALPEVSTAFKLLAKKHKARLKKIDSL